MGGEMNVAQSTTVPLVKEIAILTPIAREDLCADTTIAERLEINAIRVSKVTMIAASIDRGAMVVMLAAPMAFVLGDKETVTVTAIALVDYFVELIIAGLWMVYEPSMIRLMIAVNNTKKW